MFSLFKNNSGAIWGSPITDPKGTGERVSNVTLPYLTIE